MSGVSSSSYTVSAMFSRAHKLRRQAEHAKANGDHNAAMGAFHAALSAFTQLEDYPGSAKVLAELAELHLAAGDYAAAVDLRRQEVERVPGDPDALTGLGYAQWFNGSPADAEVTFDHALNRDRKAAHALAGRGQIRADLGDYADALPDLDHALDLGITADDETSVRSARALALAGLGRFDEAESELGAALDGDPNSPRSLLRAGRIAMMAGRLDQARDQLRRALQVPQSAGPLIVQTARRILAMLDD